MNLVFCVLTVLKYPARHSRHYLVICCIASRTDSENSLLTLAKRIPLILTELNLGRQWRSQSFYAISYSVSLKRITQLAYDFDCTCLRISCRFCKKYTIVWYIYSYRFTSAIFLYVLFCEYITCTCVDYLCFITCLIQNKNLSFRRIFLVDSVFHTIYVFTMYFYTKF
jgi:hypothetical protein